MHSLAQSIKDKSGEILNVYFTAGHPSLDSIVTIIEELEANGVDLVEIGMPYSDPLADGPTIQGSSQIALQNGASLETIFHSIKESRKSTSIPIILMGYFNQLLQYGVEEFLTKASSSGVGGFIIPDLPMEIYEEEYKGLFEKYNMAISFLITPLTSHSRILTADRLSTGFVYMVSQTSITGSEKEVDNQQIEYYNRIEKMKLKSPRLIGFGIHDHDSFITACHHSDGAIIGSAFIRAISESTNLSHSIAQFIKKIRV